MICKWVNMKHSLSVFLLFFSALFIAVAAVSCKKNKEEDPDKDTTFNKKDMLTSFADKVILPSLADLATAVATMKTTTDAFVAEPSSATLGELRERWKEAHAAFLHCHSFNYGPGEKLIIGMMAENIGIWPVKDTLIENRISTGNTDFSADFDRDVRGFLALDYLLYKPESVDALLSGADSKRVTYLVAVVDHIQQWVTEVNTGWTSGGYRSTFINNDGKDVGSSVGMLYNEFLKSYEAIKNFKLGLPAGKRVGQPGTRPDLVEAYYSGLSNFFIKEHLKAVENLWRGRSKTGDDGIGFDDWLASLKDGAVLKTDTEQRFALLREKTATLSDDERLSDLIISDLSRVEILYEEYAQTTRYIKSDLSSLIGIAITFSSGDGD